MEYQANCPYPKVEVKAKNPYYVMLLLEDYSGVISELTAITQYIYQKTVDVSINQEYSEVLLKIAIVEMKHLNLLGETITLLGGKPEFHYFDSCLGYQNWSSNFLNYQTNLSDSLVYDIFIEEKTIQNYLNHIQLIHDSCIQRLLYRIIEDEKKHIACFQELLRKIQSC